MGYNRAETPPLDQIQSKPNQGRYLCIMDWQMQWLWIQMSMLRRLEHVFFSFSLSAGSATADRGACRKDNICSQGTCHHLILKCHLNSLNNNLLSRCALLCLLTSPKANQLLMWSWMFRMQCLHMDSYMLKYLETQYSIPLRTGLQLF